jgi:hypothetical protein
MYTLKGKNSNDIDNLRADDEPLLVTEILLQSVNANSMTGSAPANRGQVTFTATGNFTFNVTPKTWADVTGTFLSLNVFFDGILIRTESWLEGINFQKYFDFTYQKSLLSGNDYFEGSSTYNGNDQVQGLGGDDSYKGYFDGQYGDYFFGGSGTDSSIYRGKASEYTITRSSTIWDGRLNDGSRASGVVVKDSVKDRDGTDSLVEVERLQFSDQTVALDISGTAGQAYRVYQAAFNRTPDLGGLGYWISAMDGGASLKSVAGGFVSSAEFKALYGASPTHAQIVTKFYENVLHRAPESGGYNYWLGILNAGQGTVTDVLAAFSESPENQSGVISVIEKGIRYTPYIGPSYSLSASATSVNEGTVATFTLRTTNVAEGTPISYTLSGISAADILGGSLSGNAVVNPSGVATISATLLNDLLTEGAEMLRVNAGGATSSIVVNDTSITLVGTAFGSNPGIDYSGGGSDSGGGGGGGGGGGVG